jgi:exopolysaccharide production protein ExoY
VFLDDSYDRRKSDSTLKNKEVWQTLAPASAGGAEALAATGVSSSHADNSLNTAEFANRSLRQSMPLRQPGDRPIGGWSKRLLDIVVAITALILLSPLILIISLLILVTLKRPILFSHMRIGFNGRPFRCYKFRTMVLNADEVFRQHIATNKAAAEEWAAAHKLAKDPRVTFLGHLLRISSLDELPQFINVICGDMSCVGPRPVVADELLRYGESAKAYLKARPGLTGYWQVSGRNALTYDDRVALDRDYVENWSFWRDIGILLKTIPAVIRFEETS